MSYNSRLSRVRVEFPASECFAHWKPPRDLLIRVEEKFKQERNDGFIETYLIFAKRFDDFWALVRSREKEIDPNRIIKFTLGQGGRIYSEIRLTTSGDKVFFNCEIPAKKMSTISFSSFLFNTLLKIEQLDFSFTPDRAQLKFLFMLLKNGQKLAKVQLKVQPSAEDNTRRGFAIRFHTKERYASLHVFEPHWFKDEANVRSLIFEAYEQLQKLNTAKTPLHRLEEHSVEKLKSLQSKVQAFGYQMPYDLLIAYDEAYCLNSKLLAPVKTREDQMALAYQKPKSDHMRLNGDFLHFELEPDRMSAKLIAVNEKILKEQKERNLQMLQDEFLKAGLKVGYDDFLPVLLEKLNSAEMPIGMIVAEGRTAEAGQSQHLSFPSQEESSETLDLRERQNNRLVRQGGLIAEVRYTDGPKGSTVDGREYSAYGSAASLGMVSGDGVSLVNDNQFFATLDGIVQIEGSTVSVQKAYTHKGSVNFASGNIHFEGAVIIEGDIEASATVEVDGTLIVKGSIESAKVRCSGDLEVKGGVNTGKLGYVHVGGNAKIGFIENSILHIKQSLAVEKSITHSLVISGGVINVLDTSKGQIVGGLSCAWQAIICAKFGTSQGQVTQCRLGSHHLNEIRFQRLATRLKFFETAESENLKSIALFERPGLGLTPEQKNRHLELKKKSKRYKSIVAKIKVQKNKVAQNKVYNPDATLVVADILEKNSSIWISGKKISIQSSLKGVLASSHISDGILDLNDVDKFSSQHPSAIVKA